MKTELSTKYYHAGSSNEFDLAVEVLERTSRLVNFALISAKIGIIDISEISEMCEIESTYIKRFTSLNILCQFLGLVASPFNRIFMKRNF